MAQQAAVSKKNNMHILAQNVSVSDKSKLSVKDTLPNDIVSDLMDSFEYFAKGQDLISRNDFESIIHNFGFNSIQSQSEKQNLLTKMDSEYQDRTGFTRDFLKDVVTYHWNKGNGMYEEVMSAFNVFDRHSKGIKQSDLKAVFAEYLDHPVTDQDIADIMEECDKQGSGVIKMVDFRDFYFAQ